MSNIRFNAIEEATGRKPVEVPHSAMRAPEYYGNLVFDRKQMNKYLSKDTRKALTDTIDKGKRLPREIAEHVAEGMKRWAIEMGATHYSHWFQPLNDSTAEKHDSFVDYAALPGGDIVEKFSGNLLVQQEPDASSFPSGGLRNTFEARGYTAWDPSSPAFIVDDTLCIPTVFIAYTGEALDYKTPFLKSLSALDKSAVEVCKLFDPAVKKVITYLGWEQEFFLVDIGLYHSRPDLKLTGRTLMGHESAKNQQLDDHYFAAIPERVAAYLREVEMEAYKYGIPLKTRHNEVAPNQFEIAPIYGEANLANDQNLIMMSVLDKVALKHNFKLLLHEKPFAGINGSGKHNNWSLATDTGTGLFTPGKTAHENLQFITFLVNAMMAVFKHNDLLKASIMTGPNAQRLGANEAPPTIISVFLGQEIASVLDKIETNANGDDISVETLQKMKLGLAHLPEVIMDNTDRNRTSPFAFTGNRFEFRAVGSSANCAASLIVLNSIMAKQLIDFKQEIDRKMEAGLAKEEAIYDTIRVYIRTSKDIRFDGNGYSEEWHEEAKKRGLNCETSVPLIYDSYVSEQSVSMFEQVGVMNRRELEARNEVKWETYTKKVQIEARVLGDLSMNHIIPVATKYQTALLDNVTKLNAVFDAEKAKQLNELDIFLIEEIARHISGIKNNVDLMVEARRTANVIESEREKAIAYYDTVAPYLNIIRYHTDKLELVVDNQIWPLPKYRELLFIS